jgi:hypothetical protein
MINFIPKAFTGEEDTCPVCIARVQLEAVLEGIELAFVAAQPTEGKEKIAAYFRLTKLFSEMQCDYRVAFAINLSIWFSAERCGRAKKVPDLVMAYDEYRECSVNSFEAYQKAFAELSTAIGSSVFNDAHLKLADSITAFFTEVDKWTVKRREDAFRTL